MLILCLCDATGIMSDAFRRRGHQVLQVDIRHGLDVLTWLPPPAYDGVAAFPPCTVFTAANAHRWPTITDADFFHGLAVATRCWEIAVAARRWWFLENPQGRLSCLLGRPAFRFHPHHFGDPWLKRTQLWGRFNPPVPRRIIPTHHLVEAGHRRQVPSLFGYTPTLPETADRPHHRSATSPGFAAAFAAANA